MVERILAGSTLPPYVFTQGDTRYWGSWLACAEALKENAARVGAELNFHATLEYDDRGMEVFAPLAERLGAVNEGTAEADLTYYRTEPGAEFTSANRLAGICEGRNLLACLAASWEYDWILYLDADMRPPSDAIGRLLELGHPMCGGHVPTYGLTGPLIDGYPDEWEVRAHMNTAGFLLVHESVFTQLTWRVDVAAGMTDDPCYHADALAMGAPTYVRHDTVGMHFPLSLPPMEQRGHDRRKYVA